MSGNKLVECVPNFSEGRNQEVIDSISEAIKTTSGVTLLDVDSSYSTNRTVYTFVGSPDAVIEGALNATIKAASLIDMRKHFGEHKRLGALDVCPFIPVKNVEMEECVYCARKLASKLASTLNIPVYLYGYASNVSYRSTVPQIRSGEYEGLKNKLTQSEWKPDYGPATFVPTFGASIVGARKYLIAYNVNLIATKEQAHRIALNIRENGRGDSEPGRLKAVQALSFWLKEENLAQVSVNITNLEITGIHDVYEEVVKQATNMKLPVVGSQIVGLIPLKAILSAAEYYIKKESLFVLEEDQKVRLVIQRLGLSSLGHFDPQDRIIEYKVKSAIKLEGNDALVNLTVSQFINEVGDRKTAPAGGSVSSLVGSLGAALGSMVAKLSYGKKAFESIDGEMRRLIPIFHHSMTEIGSLVDADTNAYKSYVEAMKLPSDDEESAAVKAAALDAGIKQAVDVPFTLAKSVSKLWLPCKELAKLINITSVSDLEVGILCLHIATKAAFFNVRTNLKATKDEKFKNAIWKQMQEMMDEAELLSKEILEILNARNASDDGTF